MAALFKNITKHHTFDKLEKLAKFVKSSVEHTGVNKGM